MRKTIGIILLLFCSMILGQGACAESIGEIKSYPLGSPVMVEGVVTWVKGFECYVQSQDRIGGIWVQGNTIGINMGDTVTVAGALAMDDYELVIAQASIYPSGGAMTIAPFAMKNKSVAGAYAFQQFRVQDRVAYKMPNDGIDFRWDYAGGASNVGMLVKTWGTVKSTYYSAESGVKWFHIDDGSGVTSDFGDTGILVYSGADVKQGDVVSVTGVSSVELALDQPDKLIRVIRPRWSGDVEVLRAYEKPQIGFSDEFNGTEIDPRWTIIPGPGSYSVESGNLVLIPEPVYNLGNRAMLAQRLPESYDLDIKVDLDVSDDPAYLEQGVSCVPAFTANHLEFAEPYQGDFIWIGDSFDNHYPLLGRSFLFHLSGRGDTATGRISYDGGATYSQDYTMPGRPILLLYAVASTTESGAQPSEDFRAYIDYIRITPVEE